MFFSGTSEIYSKGLGSLAQYARPIIRNLEVKMDVNLKLETNISSKMCTTLGI